MSEKQVINLKLKDIILIKASNNDLLHDKKFIITFISKERLIISDVINNNLFTLNINENQEIVDTSIESFELLYSHYSQGFADGNNLNINTWIDIHFNIPNVGASAISGQITNKEEDMIEIKTYPNNDYIYIDFAYEGIPSNLNISAIHIRSDPPYDKKSADADIDEDIDAITDIESKKDDFVIETEAKAEELEDITSSRLPSKEIDLDFFNNSEINLTEKAESKENINVLNEEEIKYGDMLDDITQIQRVSDDKIRYSLEDQLNDILETYLSTIPTKERTEKKLQEIYLMISRFKNILIDYSDIDEYGNVINIKNKQHPFVEYLLDFTHKINWIIPCVANKVNIYQESTQEEDIYYDDVNVYDNTKAVGDIEDILKKYKNSTTKDQQSKYYTFLKDLQDLEFKDNLMQDTQQYKPKHNVDCIINNYDFKSSAFNNDEIVEKRFVKQRYTIPLSLINKENKKVSVNDNVWFYLKSFIFLSNISIYESKLFLPKTCIYLKHCLNIANSHNTKSNLLDRNIKTVKLLNKINMNFGSPTEYTTYNDVEKKIDYMDYVNTLIPDHNAILSYIKFIDSITSHDLSMQYLINQLEPFNMYDMNSSYYQTLKTFLNKEINLYKNNYSLKKRKFDKLQDFVEKPNYIKLETLLYNKTNNELINSIVKETYNIEECNNSEFISNILKKDSGNLFFSSIALTNLNLISIIDIENNITTIANEYKSTLKEKLKTDECKEYVLSKKYTSYNDLQSDNDIDIYYDAELDPTRYDILSEYKNQQNTMSSDDFMVFLQNELQQNVNMPQHLALQEAKAMLINKRIVENNNYAVLYENDIDSRYFIRKDNKWEEDTTIPNVRPESNDLFCSHKEKCLTLNNNCTDKSVIDEDSQLKTLEQMTNEYDIKYEINKDNLKILLENNCRYYKYYIKKCQEREITMYRNKYKNIKEYEQQEQSKYYYILNIILSQSDFYAQQKNIYRFCNLFTRESNKHENVWFRYCKESNLPLIPIFLYELSLTWIETNDFDIYIKKLEYIKKTQGNQSDDGDMWVDKYTGYKICDSILKKDDMIDDTVEVDKGGINVKEIKDINIDLNNEYNKYGLIIVNGVLNTIGITLDKQSILTFIIKPLESKITPILKESKAKLLKTNMANDKIDEKLKYAKFQYIALYTLAYLYILMQTSIPSIKIKNKRLKDCRRDTYDTTFNIDDDSGIICIISAFKKLKIDQEPNLKKFVKFCDKSPEKIRGFFIDTINIIKNEDAVLFKINKKIEYLSNKKKEPVEIENKYDLPEFYFLMYKFKIKDVSSISEQVITKLKKYIATGDMKQHIAINVIKSKLYEYSIRYIYSVNKIIDSKALHLTNSKNQPYKANSCCEEPPSNFVNAYLDNENNSLMQYKSQISNLDSIINDIKQNDQPLMKLYNKNTKLDYNYVYTIDEDIIYSLFIKLCNFDNYKDIPEEYLSLCRLKPSNFNEVYTLQEQIDHLKKENFNYTNKDYINLLKLFNKNNILKINYSQKQQTDISIIQERIDNIMISIYDKNLLEIFEDFKKLLDTFNIKNYNDTNKYLDDLIDKIYDYKTIYIDTIQSFLSQYINTKKLKINMEIIKEFISKDIEDKTCDMVTSYNLLNYFKMMIKDFMYILPNIIYNKVNYKNIDIPEYWKLSDIHKDKIKTFVAKYYSKFLDGNLINNTLLSKLLLTTKEELEYVYEFINALTFYKDTLLDKTLIVTLIEILFIKIITCYIENINQSIDNTSNLSIESLLETKEIMVDEIDEEDVIQDRINKETNIKDDKEKLQNAFAEYLFIFIDYSTNVKNTTIMSIKDIKYKVNKSKQKEKDRKTIRLYEMTDEARQLDNEMKQHKLGVWSLGLEKGLTQYVADFYDREIQEDENFAVKHPEMTYDEQEQFAIDEEIEKEENDLTFLGDDDIDLEENDDM